jgi:glycosyltransferase involved in cell wall biosynthesis
MVSPKIQALQGELFGSVTEPATPPIRSLEVFCHLDPRYGGVATSVPTLVAEMTRRGSVCATPLPILTREERGLAPEWLPIEIAGWLSPRYWHQLRNAIEVVDLVHVHGLWQPASLLACELAIRARKRLIISPHGMLDRWALQRKAWKKQLAGLVVQQRLLQDADAVRALTAAEDKAVREYCGTDRVRIIPNGTSLPPAGLLPRIPNADLPSEAKVMTLLSRLHPKKGIDLLLRVWPQIAVDFPDWHLVLAGPNEGGLPAEAGAGPRVHCIGPLNETERWELLLASRLFVLPSYSEGFSKAVLEAMAASLPVVISRACNFPEVTSYGAGWVVDLYDESVEATLRQALSSPDSLLTRKGEIGRTLVESQYSDAAIASRMTSLYGDVMRWKGTEPSHSWRRELAEQVVL